MGYFDTLTVRLYHGRTFCGVNADEILYFAAIACQVCRHDLQFLDSPLTLIPYQMPVTHGIRAINHHSRSRNFPLRHKPPYRLVLLHRLRVYQEPKSTETGGRGGSFFLQRSISHKGVYTVGRDDEIYEYVRTYGCYNTVQVALAPNGST